jgi:transglutaminase-like putative cysteine protease
LLFSVKHIERIQFGGPVFCEPTLIRMQPRTDGAHHLRHFRLEVQPQPAGISQHRDLSGNVCWTVWFNEITVALKIITTSQIEVWPQPATEILRPEAVTVPVRHKGDDYELAQFYARPEYHDDNIRQFARQLTDESNGTTLDFIAATLRRLKRDYLWIPQRSITSRGLAHVVRVREGSYEDAALLLAELAREVNIPARIVRGYSAALSDEVENRMHPWTELYLPGTGWRGYDPIRGVSVDAAYLPVTVGRTYALTESVEGRQRGNVHVPRRETQIYLRQHQESLTPIDGGPSLARPQGLFDLTPAVLDEPLSEDSE